MRHCIYPGTFDPITYGHLDVLARAAKLFDHVTVAVAHNAGKGPLFTAEQRLAMLVPNLVSAEQSLREGIAAVRLLRMAVALHRGEDAPPLPDPLGDGALRVEPAAEGTRLSSAGTAARPQLVRIVRR